MTEDVREAKALFRYGLISEFLDGRSNRGERRRRMRELASRSYVVSWKEQPYPVSMSQLSRWLGAFRRRGLEGLEPAVRKDKGTCKALHPLMEKRIVAIKEQTPELSIPELIRSLEDAGEAVKDKLKASTVHRLLQRHGLSALPGKGRGHEGQRLPFRFDLPMELWVGDVMHGRVMVQDRKVYLIAFMDNATRAIMHAAFAFDEGALSVLEVFRQALLVRGVCKRTYVDHGSAYVDARFLRTCAHLGIHLLHAPVKDGAAKGAIERWFGRLRKQFEAFLQEDDLVDLKTLNSLLWGWIHSTYHKTPHHGLDGETPWGRFMRLLGQIKHRRVEPALDFWTLWRTRVQRTVRRDGTVSLNGHCLEVPPTVCRKRVELRFVEEKLPEGVQVWSDEKMIGPAELVDLGANTTRRRWRPKGPKPAKKAPLVDPLARSREVWAANK
jgi:transposase InsO family protein